VEYPPESNDTSRPDRVPFQFGLGRLFVLMAACAGVLSVVNMMKAPVLFRLGVDLYLMFMAAYVVFRIPHIYQIWKRVHRKRRERETLAAEARAAARQIKEAKEVSANGQTRAPTTPDRPDG
jgi:hypothetical protein